MFVKIKKLTSMSENNQENNQEQYPEFYLNHQNRIVLNKHLRFRLPDQILQFDVKPSHDSTPNKYSVCLKLTTGDKLKDFFYQIEDLLNDLAESKHYLRNSILYSLIRESTNPRYDDFLKLTIPNLVESGCLAVDLTDNSGDDVDITSFVKGTHVDVEVHITGAWCFNNKIGLKTEVVSLSHVKKDLGRSYHGVVLKQPMFRNGSSSILN
jgi:hypothetical protein